MSSYVRVPIQESNSNSSLPTIEEKDSSSRSNSNSNLKQQDEVPASKVMVIFSVGFYLVAATTMVMANKWVLNAIEIPLFFLFCQLSIAVLLLHASSVLGLFKLPRVDVTVCKGLVPLISVNVLGLAFNTYCLQFVDASFYQVARGLVLPFTVFLSWFLLRAHSSPRTLVAVGIVCVGFFLGVASENIKTSSLGIVLGVASSLTTAIHAIIVKKTLPIVNNNTLDLVYYSNLLSAFVILPFVLLSGEGWVVLDLFTRVGKNPDALRTFLVGATVTGVFGFLICIAGFLSIKVTSPVSHMVSSAVRGVLQTFLGISLFGDHVGTGRASGIVFILSGSIYYVYTKSFDNTTPSKAQELPTIRTTVPSASNESEMSEKTARVF